jgi:putative endopeptidase
VDFYQFACGNWMKNNPIPADKSAGGVITNWRERNRLHPARHPGADTSVPEAHRHRAEGRRLLRCLHGRDYHREARHRAAHGFHEPDRRNQDKQELIQQAGRCSATGSGALFIFGQMPDMHDSRQTVANLDQGGLTLPDRDYYIKDEAKSVETRQKYLEHVQKMFELWATSLTSPRPKPDRAGSRNGIWRSLDGSHRSPRS